VITARIRIGEPHRQQVNGSTSYTCAMSLAQVERLSLSKEVWVYGKRKDCGSEYAFNESDGTILLRRTATVLVAVLYNKQKICHGGQILLLQRGGIKRRNSLEIDCSDRFFYLDYAFTGLM